MTASGSPLSAELTEQFVGFLDELFLPSHNRYVVDERPHRNSIERDLHILPDGPTPTGLLPSVLRVKQHFTRAREDQPRYTWKLTDGTREDAPFCQLLWDRRLTFHVPEATTPEEWETNSAFTEGVAGEEDAQAALKLLRDLKFVRAR